MFDPDTLATSHVWPSSSQQVACIHEIVATSVSAFHFHTSPSSCSVPRSLSSLLSTSFSASPSLCMAPPFNSDISVAMSEGIQSQAPFPPLYYLSCLRMPTTLHGPLGSMKRHTSLSRCALREYYTSAQNLTDTHDRLTNSLIPMILHYVIIQEHLQHVYARPLPTLPIVTVGLPSFDVQFL